MTDQFAVLYHGPFDVSVVPRDEAQGEVIATGLYQRSLESIGWDVLKVETKSRFDDVQQAYAAGYFEGISSGFRIPDHVANITHFQPVSPQVGASLRDSLDWLDANLPEQSEADPYWRQVTLLLTYFNGMHAGINASGVAFSRYDLFQLAALADIASIESGLAAQANAHPDWRAMSCDEMEEWFHDTTHCSALFKLAPDQSEIWFGHCTWIFWPWMARVFKHITLNYNAPEARAKTVTMSSWVGAMSSLDDFYQTSAGLTVLETSISVFDPQVWIEGGVGVSPDKLLYWIRAMVAMRMGDDAESWKTIFSRNNGGTYNNEWYVLDRKRFTPGEAPRAGLLTAINQLPTMICSQDMSHVLAKGHVASYNVPVIQKISDVAGYPEAAAKSDQAKMTLSYTDCARARIFDAQQHSVDSIEAMRFMMQYNSYDASKALSDSNNPMYAIASRGDKKPKGAKAFGAIDAKISSISLASQGIVEAFSGPTPQQGPFSFDNPSVDVGPHAGIPTQPAFSWQIMKD